MPGAQSLCSHDAAGPLIYFGRKRSSTDLRPAALLLCLCTYLQHWGSENIHRVVKSTLAAEAAAGSYGYDRGVWARAVYGEVLGLAEHEGQTWTELVQKIPH